MAEEAKDSGKVDVTTGGTDGEGKAGDQSGTDANKDTDKGKASDGLERDLATERRKRQKLEDDYNKLKTANMSEQERIVSERDTLKTTNDTLSLENTKLKLALKMELPWTWARRITGDTPEEMEADAKDLLATFKRQEGDTSTGKTDTKETGRKTTNDGKKSGESAGTTDMNAMLRKAAGR